MLQRVSALVGITLLGACDRNDPVQPRPIADLLSDVTPPTLTAFNMSPTSINTSDGPAPVRIDFTLTDDASGATGIVVFFSSPSPRNVTVSGQAFFAASTTVSTSLLVDFSQYSETGTWTVYDVRLLDASGNETNLSTPDLVQLGFPSTVTVFSSLEDVTPPILTALSFSPTTINTSNGSSTVTISYSLADDLSGVFTIWGWFCHPGSSDPGSEPSLEWQDNFSPTQSRSASLEFTFPQSSPTGTWTLCILNARDLAGNNLAFYSAADLSALGFPVTLNVVNVAPVSIDIQPGSSTGSIKLSKPGKVAVAILSDGAFDAPATVVRTTLTFGHTGNEASLASCAKGGEDINGDGFEDLVCRFYVDKTGFQVGDLVGILRGRTVNQIPIEGRDVLRVLK